MLENHYKEAFERASEERQELILETGIEEFSSKGYEKANIMTPSGHHRQNKCNCQKMRNKHRAYV